MKDRAASYINIQTIGQWVNDADCVRPFRDLTGTPDTAADLKQAVFDGIAEEFKANGLVRVIDLARIIDNAVKELRSGKWSGRKLSVLELSTCTFKQEEISFSINSQLVLAWIDIFKPRIWRIAKDNERAARIYENLYLKFFRNLSEGKLNGVRNLGTYVYGAVSNERNSILREEIKKTDVTDSVEDRSDSFDVPDTTKGENFMQGEQAARELMGRLTAIQRKIVFLKAELYTEKEIAGVLGVQKCVVSYEMSKVRKLLKNKLMNEE